jgi:hypothetical protein
MICCNEFSLARNGDWPFFFTKQCIQLLFNTREVFLVFYCFVTLSVPKRRIAGCFVSDELESINVEVIFY